MIYHAVGNRCAVDFAEIQLPVPVRQSLDILKEKGFQEVEVDLVELARRFIGVSEYRRGAMLSEAPNVFDCSSFVKWLYGQKGIWLPRRSVQQREFGTAVNLHEIRAEDVIFTSGFIDYYLTDPESGVGHVGIATSSRTVIHAANRKIGIVESSLDNFASEKKLRGIRRIIPDGHRVHTFITPNERGVEWSDDIRWIIFQNLPA